MYAGDCERGKERDTIGGGEEEGEGKVVSAAPQLNFVSEEVRRTC